MCVSLATLRRATGKQTAGKPTGDRCPTEAEDSESLNTAGSATGTAWSSCHRQEYSHQAEGAKRGSRCKHDCAFNGRRGMFDRDGWQPTNKLCWTSFPDSEDEGANGRGRGAARSASVPDATPCMVPGPSLVGSGHVATKWC